MPCLSIVVPVYNTEKYLERCVSSIISQVFSDWELILVDDGSTDGSLNLCDGYAKQDSRIRVIHKENGGLSSARNAGLAVATGKYIGFIDSDDSVKKNMYSRMIGIIEKYDTDFVMSDYQRIPRNGKPFLKTLNIREGLYTKEDIRRDIYPSLIMGGNIDHGPLLSVWHCVYNAEFLRSNNILFDEMVLWSEDNLFSAVVGYHADSFYYLKGEDLYNYYQNEGTITTSYRKGAWNVYSHMNKVMQEFFEKKKDYDFSQELKWHMIYYACVCVSQTKSLSDIEAKEELWTILNSPQLVKALEGVNLQGVNSKLKAQLFLMKYKCIQIVRYLAKHR